MTIEDIEKNNSFTIPRTEDVIIKVIGVGGGGNNAVQHMYKQGIEGVSFVICNTDRQALINSPVPTKVMIGECGLGAGNDPEVARQAAEDSLDELRQLFDDKTKMVFITAGMGGGTGTGAAPVVARVARESGMLTIGIVTIPFLFEGQRKILKALDGAEEMSKYVDALLVINNERLTEIYPDFSFLNAFGKADDTLTIAAHGISELITNNEHVINIDFRDVNTTLRNGGAAVISIGYGEGENRVTKAINDALNSPLLKDRDIFDSKRILFNIYFNPKGEQEFVMREANELTEFISKINPEVDVIWGMAKDESLGNKVKITLLAAGFKSVTKPENRKKAEDPNEVPGVNGPDVIFVNPEDKVRDRVRIEDLYGTTKTDTISRTPESQKVVILTPDQLNDDSIIEKFEKNPTFTRDRRVVEEIKNKTKKTETPQPADGAEDVAPHNEGQGGTCINFIGN